MAITTKKAYSGQKRVETLKSQIRIEEGNNRLLIHDGTNYRIIFGEMPDGTIGMIISKPGIDVLGLFD